VRFAKFKDLQVQKNKTLFLIFTYSIISAVFHQFHEVVASDNSRRDNIHETHFDAVDLEIERKTGQTCVKPSKVEQIKKRGRNKQKH
jgi:hypothetical protein